MEKQEEEILKKIGAKLKEVRLAVNMKQKELSEKSGLSMFSISQMETGHNTSVLSLVQVLRALDRMDLLDPFLKERQVDAELLEKFIQSQPPQRQRATSPRTFFTADEEDDAPGFRMVADDTEIEWNKTKK